MKILLSGTQGSGKSTLNKALLKKLPDYISLDSLSSKYATSKEDFKDPKKLKLFQTKVSLYCFSQYLDLDNYVSSRSIADAYAYNKYEYTMTKDVRYKIFMDLTLDLVEEFSQDNYLNIFVPKMFDAEATNIRSGNIEFQNIIDKYIKEFFDISGLRFTKITELDIDKRVNEVLNALKRI